MKNDAYNANRWSSPWWGALLMDDLVYYKADIVACRNVDPSSVKLPTWLKDVRFRNPENAHEAVMNLRTVMAYQYEKDFGMMMSETPVTVRPMGADEHRYLYEVCLHKQLGRPCIVLQIQQEDMFVFEDAVKTAVEMGEIVEGSPFGV